MLILTDKQKKILLQAGDILLNIIGSSLLAFGICAFVDPFGLVVGGATGISLIVHRLFGINLSIVSFAINMLALLPALIAKEKKLFLGSVLSSIVCPAAIAVFERIPQITSIADSTALAMICGGVVCGAGIGLVMKSGGSTGGLDIPELLVARWLRLPVNKVMNAMDTCIMVAQIPFSVIANVLYGLIYTYIMTYTLNSVLTFGEDRLKVSIVSEQYQEICSRLTSMDYGVTMIYAEGGYTKTPIEKIESVMTSSGYHQAQKAIMEIDSTAFITIEKVKDVRGRGYTLDRIWIDMDNDDNDNG